MSDLNLKKTVSKNSEGGSQTFNDYQDDYEYEFDENDLGGNQISDENITFIPEQDILKEREKMIQEASEKLFLERPQAILAMIYLEWNIDNIDNWYEDADNNRYKAGIELSPKTKELLKKSGVVENGDCCSTCYEEKNDTFFALSCGHLFCADCWTEYLKEKLKNPLGALTVRCQQGGCTCIVPEEIYKKFITDKIQLERLDKAIFKNFINRNEDLKQCPNPKCHFYAKSNMHSAREINCMCGTTYCFKCSKDTHRPCSCDMFEKWLRLHDSSKNDDKWIEANTKECPHCHQKIEKSQGCNYMLCNKSAGGCGHAFCYVCETDWAKHSQDHFNCNKYTDAVKNKEKKANQLKEQLKRTDFYFSLYMNNKKAVDILDTKTRNDIGEKINLLVTLKNMPILETKFIIEAVNTTIKGKRLLKNTYIFGYYMKDNDKKKYFEHEQGILQYWTEELHRHLIDDQLNLIIQEERYSSFTERFKEYKNSLNNIIGSIEKYSKGLVDDIENNFIGEIDYKLLDE
jgi:ariadne-1